MNRTYVSITHQGFDRSWYEPCAALSAFGKSIYRLFNLGNEKCKAKMAETHHSTRCSRWSKGEKQDKTRRYVKGKLNDGWLWKGSLNFFENPLYIWRRMWYTIGVFVRATKKPKMKTRMDLWKASLWRLLIPLSKGNHAMRYGKDCDC